ncbi:MAG: ribosome hibernation-promoting factor, HPF/YfiA family [Anaerolineae bacterium]
MQVIVTGKNLEINDQLRDVVESKVTKLDRYLPDIDEARVELSAQKTKSAKDSHVVQLTLRSNSTILRSEERSADLRTALDAVLDKMTRQIDRYKGKHWRSQVRVQGIQPEAEVEAETDSLIIRTKRFSARPMSTDEAIEQMELLGHDFFVFYDAATEEFAVVYRRRNQGYGLLLPELA